MIPRTPETLEEAVSAQWLTEALRVRYPGIDVVSVEPGPVVSRITTNARLRIECAGELPDGLPAELCVKGYFNEIGRLSRSAGPPEVVFYRDLAPGLGLRTLRPVYAEIDDGTGHAVIITEDVVAKGTRFLTAASEYTVDQAALSLEQLATLHASTWGRPDLANWPSLANRFDRFRSSFEDQVHRQFSGPNSKQMPPGARDASRLIAAYQIVERQVATADPWCVIHGDPHPGNVIIDSQGRPGFVDWQLVQRGPWFIDVGYHLAASLPTEERRSSERALLGHYLDTLITLGLPAPSDKAALSAIRSGAVHGLLLWAITRFVDPPTIATLLERLGTTVLDWDGFDLTDDPYDS